MKLIMMKEKPLDIEHDKLYTSYINIQNPLLKSIPNDDIENSNIKINL